MLIPSSPGKSHTNLGHKTNRGKKNKLKKKQDSLSGIYYHIILKIKVACDFPIFVVTFWQRDKTIVQEIHCYVGRKVNNTSGRDEKWQDLGSQHKFTNSVSQKIERVICLAVSRGQAHQESL